MADSFLRNHRPVDIRVRVSGGGHTSQVYAIRQAIAKALVAYYAKFFDASSALDLRQLFISYDRTLLIADPRRMEPKKFGGKGARARRQKVGPFVKWVCLGNRRADFIALSLLFYSRTVDCSRLLWQRLWPAWGSCTVAFVLLKQFHSTPMLFSCISISLLFDSTGESESADWKYRIRESDERAETKWLRLLVRIGRSEDAEKGKIARV